jgi:outer membrane receptor for ferric coprogen and ferric-rhodotorulic acid
MNTHLKMTNRVNFLANSIAKSLLCAALVTPLVLTSTWVNAEAIQQPFSIPAGDLGSVISRFAANTGAVVYFDSKLTKGKKTTGLNGSFTILSGLSQLLNGSGLKVIQESDDSYLVVKDTNPPMTLSTLKIKSSSTSNNATEGSNSYIITKMTTATKMNLAVLDTPQSISVVTSAEMEDFNLTSINDVLENTVGITVEKMESDRTQFTSRGFEINNFLIDGLSLPLNYSYQYGDINMAIYDHVEVTRGATGLTSANGNPSATVNMIRKRPTEEFNAAAKLSVGSWNSKIATADVGGAVNNDKSIRARAIVDVQNAESYLDRYETDSNLLSVIVETDISDNSLLAGGFTRYEDNNKGSQWGGIPAFDGVDYDISTNASSDWTYRDVVTTDAFIELTNTLANNWQLKSTYSYKDIEQDAELMNLWVYDDVLKIDGVQAYELSSKEHVLNLTLNGDYQLFNRDSEFVLGLDLAKRDVKETSDYDNDILGTAVDLTTWDGSTATPVYDDRNDGTDYNEKQTALFAASNIHILKKLNLLLGSRISNWERKGTGYWNASLDSDDKGVFTPYAGLVYKHTDTLSVYASYTTTFKPQSYIDEK